MPKRLDQSRLNSPKLKASRVLVVGASGELGRALALRYARNGCVLMLWGRNPQKLESVAAHCRKVGAASVRTRLLDLVDGAAVELAVSADDIAIQFDLAIIASGVGDIRAEGDLAEDPAMVVRLGQVNFVAPAAITAQLAGRMALRRAGSIVLVGSAASFHALPFAAAYSGSKAGLARFADAMRIAMRQHGVRITLVSPGFIDTAAARSVPGPKPFALSADRAAELIAKAADTGKGHVIFPWPFGLLRLIDRALPQFISDRLLVALTPPPARPLSHNAALPE